MDQGIEDWRPSSDAPSESSRGGKRVQGTREVRFVAPESRKRDKVDLTGRLSNHDRAAAIRDLRANVVIE